MPGVCGAMVSDIAPVYDSCGCVLHDGHSGPHEFVSTDGEHYLWETDMECTCEHCIKCEGDYCFEYWRKPSKIEEEK